jgi:hypothetical protein
MEHRTGEIRERADAGVRFGDFFLVRPQKSDEFLQRIGRHARARDQDHRRNIDQADLLEIGRAVGQISIEIFRRGMRARAGNHDRVAVGHGLGDAVAADGAARPSHVFDNDLLAERLRHRADNHARRGVRRATGRERRNQDHVAVGISLRECARRSCEKRQGEQQNFFHGLPPLFDPRFFLSLDRQTRLLARECATGGNDSAATSWTARRAAALPPSNPEGLRRERRRTNEVQFLTLDYKPCSPSEIACNASIKLPTPMPPTMKKPRIACMAFPSMLPGFE